MLLALSGEDSILIGVSIAKHVISSVASTQVEV